VDAREEGPGEFGLVREARLRGRVGIAGWRLSGEGGLSIAGMGGRGIVGIGRGGGSWRLVEATGTFGEVGGVSGMSSTKSEGISGMIGSPKLRMGGNSGSFPFALLRLTLRILEDEERLPEAIELDRRGRLEEAI